MNNIIKSGAACALMAKKVAQEKKILTRHKKLKLSPKKLNTVSKLALATVTSKHLSSVKKSKYNAKITKLNEIKKTLVVNNNGNSKKRSYPL